MAQVDPGKTSLVGAWRERCDGFAPLFLEPVMVPALEHLSGVLAPGAVVLDLGSGSGHVADALRACGARTICLDIEAGVLAEARSRYPGGAAVAADVARLPFADGAVDAIFCFSVLQYADRDAALREMRRVLREGGRLVLVENLAGSPAAVLYRGWRALVGIRYPRRLTPLRHLAWRERARLQAGFPAARIESLFLFSALLLLIPRVYTANSREHPRSWVRALLGATAWLDARVMRAVPASRRLGWMLLLRG